MRRHLAERRIAAIKLEMGRLLRIELPRLARAAPSVSLEKLARRRLQKQLLRAFALGRPHSSKSSAGLHRLRIALRRVRYLGEFFSPVLGASVRELTVRIHTTERSLARIHDIDVGLERLMTGGLKPPHLLVTLLKQRRREHLAKLDKSWRHLTRPAFQRAVRRSLRT